MLTFDYSLDRRIILEAESLAAEGFEVVIIASPLPNSTDHNDLTRGSTVTVKRIATDFDPRDADVLLKLYFRFFRKVLLRLPLMATKMRAAYFFLKNSFHRKLAKDPFLLLPNSWAFHGAALEEKADIYFAHDLPMLPIAREVSEKTEAKLVYDAHEFWTGLSELSRLEVKTYREIESRLIHDADLAITVNSSIAERFFESYGRRPEVIMNCVDWNGKRPTHNIIREKLGLPAHMKILLYQGKFIDFRPRSSCDKCLTFQ